jgi:hypothetical protein
MSSERCADYSRVAMKMMANSEAIAVKLQKTCIVSTIAAFG